MGNQNGAPIDSTLRSDLIGPGFFHVKVGEMMLVIKMVCAIRRSCFI